MLGFWLCLSFGSAFQSNLLEALISPSCVNPPLGEGCYSRAVACAFANSSCTNVLCACWMSEHSLRVNAPLWLSWVLAASFYVLACTGNLVSNCIAFTDLTESSGVAAAIGILVQCWSNC